MVQYMYCDAYGFGSHAYLFEDSFGYSIPFTCIDIKPPYLHSNITTAHESFITQPSPPPPPPPQLSLTPPCWKASVSGWELIKQDSPEDSLIPPDMPVHSPVQVCGHCRRERKEKSYQPGHRNVCSWLLCLFWVRCCTKVAAVLPCAHVLSSLIVLGQMTVWSRYRPGETCRLLTHSGYIRSIWTQSSVWLSSSRFLQRES